MAAMLTCPISTPLFQPPPLTEKSLASRHKQQPSTCALPIPVRSTHTSRTPTADNRCAISATVSDRQSMPIAVPVSGHSDTSTPKSAGKQTTSPDMVYAVAEGSGFAAQANGMAEQVYGAGGKPLPELYKSTGNEAMDTLAFLHLLERLKIEKRSGWVREGVMQAESISDHMCRMALMAIMIPNTADRPLDIPRCVMMALVHDLAEAHVGDITPVEGVTPEDKHKLEDQAMDNFLDEMLGGEGNAEARRRFRGLWDEYEARQTPESKLVKDLDRFELALQGVEYERSHDIRTLHPFFTGSIPNIEHPTIRGWTETLMQERKALWASRGRAEEERVGLKGLSVGSLVDAASAKAAGAGTNGQ